MHGVLTTALIRALFFILTPWKTRLPLHLDNILMFTNLNNFSAPCWKQEIYCGNKQPSGIWLALQRPSGLCFAYLSEGAMTSADPLAIKMVSTVWKSPKHETERLFNTRHTLYRRRQQILSKLNSCMSNRMDLNLFVLQQPVASLGQLVWNMVDKVRQRKSNSWT